MIYIITSGVILLGIVVAFIIGRRHSHLQEHLLETKMVMKNLESQLGLITQNLNQRLESQNRAMQEQGQIIDQKLAVFSELKEKLGHIQSANLNMMEISKELAGGISNLRNIFTASTTRGISGEVMLENLLKQFVPHNYEMQYSLGSEKIDAVIRLDKMLVPIDAKFPYFDRFNEMLAQESEKERLKRKKELIRSVKEMIDEVQRKYIRPALNTSNFAMIYIPAENIYYELVVNDKDMEISSYSNQKNVVLVSPSTMFSYLMIIQWGLKGLKLEEETELIFQHLESLAKEMGNFKSEFEVMAGHMTRAYNKLNEANQSLLKIEARFEAVLLPERKK
ncbi:MAG: DNA recombination protein RmuC [Candidatus Omnitrophica bacterium]|nr:DNA recombination protein RmuC [Candidatus Omnitrophota bacterium]